MSHAPPFAAAMLLLGAAACDVSTAPPLEPPAISVAIVSGDAQSALAGTELPQPLVVKVVDGNNKAVRGQLVNFRVQSGGGSVYAGAALTNQQGVAQDYWTLGQVAGAQTVAVVAVDPTTGVKLNFGSFTATAIAPARLEITPANSGFGSINVGASSAPVAFTVTNQGGQASGPVSVAVSGPQAADFALSATSCAGVTLAAGVSCAFSVTFTPAAGGSRTATLTASAAPGGSTAATVSGSGVVVPALLITPASHHYGTVAVNTPGSAQTFQVQNPSPSTFAFNLQSSVSGSSAGSFFIVGGTCTPGMTLNPGASCSIIVGFYPMAAGALSAALNLTTSSPGLLPGAAALSGTGSITAAFSITPSAENYGSIPLGSSSAPRQFTVQNVGGGPSSELSVAVTGSHAGDFSVITENCTGVTLASGASCTVSVNFAPLALGARSAQLAVSATSGGTGSATLTGSGATSAQLTVTPTALDFGNVVLGSMLDMEVTLANVGASASSTISTSIVGTAATDFLRFNECEGQSLAAGASCTISIRFTPTRAAPRTATLRILEASSLVLTVNLSGTGVP